MFQPTFRARPSFCRVAGSDAGGVQPGVEKVEANLSPSTATLCNVVPKSPLCHERPSRRHANLKDLIVACRRIQSSAMAASVAPAFCGGSIPLCSPVSRIGKSTVASKTRVPGGPAGEKVPSGSLSKIAKLVTFASNVGDGPPPSPTELHDHCDGTHSRLPPG